MQIKSGVIEFTNVHYHQQLGTYTNHDTIVIPEDSYSAFIPVLSGFEVHYTNEDHHIKYETVKVFVESSEVSNGVRIDIMGNLDLADKNADDRFSGKIYYTLFIIYDAEIHANQVK